MTRWLQQVGLGRLQSGRNAALRRQVAGAVLAFTDPDADPPEELVVALGWPRSQQKQLAELLAALRTELDGWQAPISYADRGLLREMLDGLSRLDRVFVHTEAGDALRVAVVEAGLTEEGAAAIEARYREEQRLEQRVSDALARFSRLVILGEPGAGKTISLRFITLMLAHGYGMARLGLDVPYVPLLVRLADYARALEANPVLSLCNYLLDYIGQVYASHPRLSEFLRLALDRGACMVLLDGLDEVGGDPVRGRSLRARLIQKVQQFGDRWCGDAGRAARCNRIVVTSRIEGYWDDPLPGFDHVQLSPLRPPDELEAFLLRWYTAHELTYGIDAARAEREARERVDGLLPRVLEWPSVRRLATNPLLLTILALIHENAVKLPNRRIRLYEICAQTSLTV